MKQIIIIDKDLEELIPGFLENRQKDICKMKEALSTNNFEQIKIIGHQMKGFGSGYGFNYISEVGLKLEVAAKAEDIQEIERLLESLVHYLATMEMSYE